jgi:hypothetical protein
MAKRVSLKGKGADLFFGDYDPAAPPASEANSDKTMPVPPAAQAVSQDTEAGTPKSPHASMPAFW